MNHANTTAMDCVGNLIKVSLFLNNYFMSNFSSDQSKFKMVVYLKNGQRKCYYSLINEEKKGDEFALNGMIRRLLDRIHKGRYQTALIIDRYTDKTVKKYVNGKLELV